MSETVRDIYNAAERVPTCSNPAAWPPPWLVAAGEPSPPPPSIAAVTGKLAAPAVGSGPGAIDLQANEEETIPPPPPCPTCGNAVMFWWDFSGRPHCMTCDAAVLRRSRAVAERAAGLRRLRAIAPCGRRQAGGRWNWPLLSVVQSAVPEISGKNRPRARNR